MCIYKAIVFHMLPYTSITLVVERIGLGIGLWGCNYTDLVLMVFHEIFNQTFCHA